MRGSDKLFVAGVDECRAGWAWFKVEVISLATSVEVVDLLKLLTDRPSDLACLGIDIPIGLLDGSSACDKVARRMHGHSCHNLPMCGRYRLSRRKQIIEEHFDSVSGENDWSPRYNIAPTQPIPVIRQNPREPVRELSLVRWGLIPSWAKDSSVAAKMINARSETAGTKPAFRDALKFRRCLIPADGFYEWMRTGKAKQPYCFEVNEGELFAFAGLWDRWRNPSGNTVETCTILTTAPNALTAPVHDRMPVILDPDNYDLWLDPGMKNVAAASELLKPFDARLMRCYPVSTRINHVANDDEECSAPAGTQSP
jgi:putative SOS response-associated peptidase YedK